MLYISKDGIIFTFGTNFEPNFQHMEPIHFHTCREIMQQPAMWRKAYEMLLKTRKQTAEFIDRYLRDECRIIFTGAGTSAFIGDILEVALADTPFRGGRSVPTTDLITHPEAFLPADGKILMISFARSGDSPESLGAVKIANDRCKEIAHLYIICNADGELAKTAHSDNTLLLLLPPETNDASLAMTSSFSTMLLTCMLLANIHHIEAQAPFIRSLAETSARLLDTLPDAVARIANRAFDRAVFLGSGELKGIAEESHLKLQELTDGHVICCFDSFLGFRHGPEAVVNDLTILIYLFSDDPDVRRYEVDLVQQLNSNNKVVAQIAVSQQEIAVEGVQFDLEVRLGGGTRTQSIYQCIPYIFTAQLLGFYKSLNLNINPDSPSVSGNISRVVRGVTIY